MFLSLALVLFATADVRGDDGRSANRSDDPSGHAAATPSPKKEIRLESLGIKSKPMAKPIDDSGKGAASNPANDGAGKLLTVPDFSLVHKAPSKRSKSRVSMTCSSRDGRIFKPEDIGFEDCMRNASQDPGRGENIVHPGVPGALGRPVPGVEFQHRLNDKD